MNSPQKLRIKGAILLVLLLSLGLNSCKKSKSNDAPDKSGPAKVIVKMLGVEEDNQALAPSSAGNGKLEVNSAGFQTQVVPFTKGISIVARLVPAGSMATRSEINKPLSTNSTKPVLKTAAIVQNPLAPGVQYRVVVYNAGGGLVDSKYYAYGNEENVGGFILDAGETYTFLAYSINSAANAPGTNNITGDFMIFKKQMILAEGDNNLDIVFKHQLIQITTKIIKDASIPGNIMALSGVNFSPTNSSLSLSLTDGSVSYTTTGATTQAVTFPSIGTGGVTDITSTPTLVRSPGPTGKLTIGSITIGSTTKTAIEFPDLNITPGQKYNLNLTFQQVDCTAEYPFTSFGNPAEVSFTNPSIIAQARSYVNNSTTQPGTFKKVVFYVTSLNYGFGLVYTSPPLFVNNTSGSIADFLLDNVSSPLARNIQFEDGTQYGVGSVPHLNTLSNVSGSTTGPVIQIEVDAAGVVSMYGIKTSGTSAGLAPLYKLVAAPGYHFNTLPIPWNPSTSVVPQNSYGVGLSTAAGFPTSSYIKVHGVVVKTISCTN